MFNQLFFPSFDPLAGTMLSFATFAVGYASRPFGGVLFGHLGDRHGRRFVLVITLLMMGITTVLIGLLPTYAQIGVLAPVLLVTPAFPAGHGARRRMGRRRAAVGGARRADASADAMRRSRRWVRPSAR